MSQRQGVGETFRPRDNQSDEQKKQESIFTIQDLEV